MGMTKKYWKGLEELEETPSFLASKDQEFQNQQAIEEFLGDDSLNESSTTRRDFLKFLGFSVAAATLAACEAPVTKVVPYVVKPENVTPGMPTWYASTYYDGCSYTSIKVKTREGRPIFISGNKDFGFTKGGVNPQIIASVLGLYDSQRLAEPTIDGVAKSWTSLDSAVSSAIKSAKKVVLLSNTIISPSLTRAISEMELSLNSQAQAKFEHIQYDAISYAAMREANLQNWGAAIIPSYDFSKAKTIVSVDADFLATWLLPTEFAYQYGQTRKPDNKWMSKHFHFETVMSVSGSNADGRGMIKPSEQAAVLAYLIKGMGGSTSVSSNLNPGTGIIAARALKSLKISKKESLVVCGSNNIGLQLLTNKLNNILGAYGTTIDANNPIQLYKSEDGKVQKFVSNVIAGKGPDVLLVLGANPVYSLPNGAEFGKALKNIKTRVSFASHMDETASLCNYTCSDHHALEAWNDYIAKSSEYAIAQPTIRPLHNTSSALESILVWTGKVPRGGKDSTVAYEYIKNTFQGLFPLGDFAYTTHNSCTKLPVTSATLIFNEAEINSLPKAGDLEVVFYQKTSIGTGLNAGNPWLQEMPDPMTKVTWDNYITMNPIDMVKKGFVTTYDQENGLNLASIKVNGTSLTLPVYPLPGQTLNTVGVALGYGRGGNGEKIGKAAYQTKEYGGYELKENGNSKPIGANAYPCVIFQNGTYQYHGAGQLSKVEGTYIIAATQIHHTVMARHSIVRETTLDIFKNKDKEAYNPAFTLQKLNKEGQEADLLAIEQKYILQAEEARKTAQEKKDAEFLRQENLLAELTDTAEQKLYDKYKIEQEAAAGNDELLLALKNKYNKDKEALDKEAADKEIASAKDVAEKKRNLEEKKIQMTMDGLSILNDVIQMNAGKSEKAQRKAFKAQKAFNLASAIANTYLAVTGALTAGGNPIKLATGMQFVEAGIAAATGAVQIAKIAGTQFDSSSFSKDTGGDNGGGAPTMSAPQFNVVGQSGVNQLASLNQQPVQAYVVSGQVTSQQALDRNRLANATLGG